MTLSLRTPILFTAMVFLFITAGCTDTQDGETSTPAANTLVETVKPLNITGGEEILIAGDIESVKPFWCGNTDILIFIKRYRGILYYDNQSKQSFQIADYGNMPIACSPDGKWLVYKDKFNLHYDIEPSNKLAADLWRYEFKTGEKQKFLIATDNNIGTSLFKPDEPYWTSLSLVDNYPLPDEAISKSCGLS